MKTITISFTELAKKKKSAKKKSNRSLFMKALMTSFANNDPEKISNLFVGKNREQFESLFGKVYNDLLEQATPEDESND